MTRPDDTDRLFEAARGALDPPEGARERVLAGVVGAGPGGPGGGHPGGPGAAPSLGATVAKVAGVTAAAAAIVGGALLAGRAISRHRVAPSRQASAMVPATSPPPSMVAPVMTPPVPAPSGVIDLDVDAALAARHGPAAAVRAPAPTASSGADRLAEEISLLRKAQAALRSGNPSQSLSLLDEHARRFPRGVLSQERTVTRVQALCALGRTTQARTLYARLASGAPDSPHLAALRHTCPALQSE